jgi:predicted nucleic acid-binding protein
MVHEGTAARTRARKGGGGAVASRAPNVTGTGPRQGFVLDTSAVISFALDDIGADAVENILKGDQPVALPFMAVMETRYILMRRIPTEEIDQFFLLLETSEIEVPESTPEWGRRAASIKAGGGLSTADAWMAALTIMHDATLVHKDTEFDRVAGLRSLHLGRTRPRPLRK